MEYYYKANTQHKLYKLTEEQGKFWLYWVIFHKMEDGSFQCGRGRDQLNSMDVGQFVCGIMAEAATSEEYTDLLTQYLNAEETARCVLFNQKNT